MQPGFTPCLSVNACPPHPNEFSTVFRLWLLLPSYPWCNVSVCAWTPFSFGLPHSHQAAAPCGYLPTLLSLQVGATGTPFSAPTMCIYPQCCAPPIGFKTELFRKGREGKAIQRKGAEGKRKEGKRGELKGKREAEKEKEEPCVLLKLMNACSLSAQSLTHQLSFIPSLLC